MRVLRFENKAAIELLRLMEIRRKQVISAFFTGLMVGMFVIEVFRAKKVSLEPIRLLVFCGIMGALIGIPSLIGSELSIRKSLSRLAAENPDLVRASTDDGDR